MCAAFAGSQGGGSRKCCRPLRISGISDNGNTSFPVVQSVHDHLKKEFETMINVLFVCHGNILKSPGKASKINGFTKHKGAYYTTTTPFLKES